MSALVNISTGGTLEQVQREFAAMPEGLNRARARAYRKLGTWMQRQILRAVSTATDIPQARFKAMMRLYQKPIGPKGIDGVSFWVGTRPIKVHRLGAVTWTRRMRGARVGKRSFAGSWSWPQGKKTAPAVMQRTGAFGRRGNPRLETIEVVKLSIHETALAALNKVIPDAQERFATLLRQEINYALKVEAKRA
jgi:hypothetical protein